MDREQSQDRKPISAVEIDYEKYERYLEDSDLSEEEKRQLIEALWSILVGFVDLGFGIHPVQEACGQAEKTPLPLTLGGLNGVDYEDSKEPNDNGEIAAPEAEDMAERVKS